VGRYKGECEVKRSMTARRAKCEAKPEEAETVEQGTEGAVS